VVSVRFAVRAWVLLALGASACSSPSATDAGSCGVASELTSACGLGTDGGSIAGVGLVGYRCDGSARPDENPRYVEAVPEGTLCALHGSATTDGTRAYCCTEALTPCAYNPVASCDQGTDGYQCRGATRPESFNVALKCGQAVEQGDYLDYCCAGTLPAPGCQQTDICSAQLTGFTCSGSNLPRSEELGANKSHADLYSPLCPVPTPTPNPGFATYCCYVPALVPPGGSCVQDTAVPGCAPGRFGFACYGPDTPADDYLPMHCPDAGVPGRSAEGYPATLYCCDFE